MRNKVAKQLRKSAVIIAKEMYKKTSSIKTERNRWQKGSIIWCYKQLKKAHKLLTVTEKMNNKLAEV